MDLIFLNRVNLNPRNKMMSFVFKFKKHTEFKN